MTELIEVTQLWCRESGMKEGDDNSTHHLIPRRTPVVSQDGQVLLQTNICRDCGYSEKRLREEEEAKRERTG